MSNTRVTVHYLEPSTRTVILKLIEQTTYTVTEETNGINKMRIFAPVLEQSSLWDWSEQNLEVLKGVAVLYDFPHPKSGHGKGRHSDHSHAFQSQQIGINAASSLGKRSTLSNNTATPMVIQTNSVPPYNSAQLASVYNIPPQGNTAPIIALISLGGGVFPSDLSFYWTNICQFTTVFPTFVSVGVDGATNNPGVIAGDDVENTLDVQMAGGMCPHSTIVMYFCPGSFSGLFDGIQAALLSTTYPPTTISISWAFEETGFPSSTLDSFSALINIGIGRNINIFAAAGDWGSGFENNLPPQVIPVFPASCSGIVAVGGTTLICPNLVYNGNGTIETVWEFNGSSGTGGGISQHYSKPTWQLINQIIYSPGTDQTKRGYPDISAVGDPSTAVLVYYNGSEFQEGGTSVSSPLMAGLFASVFSTLGKQVFLPPIMYKHLGNGQKWYHPIEGQYNGVDINSPYLGHPGWNNCCGIGSVDGTEIFKLLQSVLLQRAYANVTILT